FQWRAGIAADAVAILSAADDEPMSQITYERLYYLHARIAQFNGRDIGQDDTAIGDQSIECGWDITWCANTDIDMCRLQCCDDILSAAWLAFNHEDTWRSLYINKGGTFIVLRNGILW